MNGGNKKVMKLFKILILFCSILFVISGCAKTPIVREKEIGGEEIYDKLAIKGSGMYEECIELRPGMVFDYKFNSSKPLKFNIHYHAEDQIYYPVLQDGVTEWEGTIDPGTHHYYTEEQEFYCLMWENLGKKLINVSFECVLREK
jgi:hypothetical protein